MKQIKLATRGSDLARWQANWVGQQLAAKHPGLSCELLEVKNLPVNHKDSFVKLCEEALLSGAADMAVHSAKDLPLGERPGLTIAAICERENPLDALVLAADADLAAERLRIGTASPRRRVQIINYRDGISVAELRGNVPTRLAAVQRGGDETGANKEAAAGTSAGADTGDEGARGTEMRTGTDGGGTKANSAAPKFDGVILAAAGLIRLGLQRHIAHYFAPQEMVPAAGQGAILIQVSAARQDLIELAAELKHPASEACVMAERHCCALLGADCDSAVGAYAFTSDGAMNIYAMVGDMRTNQMLNSYQSVAANDLVGGDKAKQLLLSQRCGQLAAEDLLNQIKQLGTAKFTYKKPN